MFNILRVDPHSWPSVPHNAPAISKKNFFFDSFAFFRELLSIEVNKMKSIIKTGEWRHSRFARLVIKWEDISLGENQHWDVTEVEPHKWTKKNPRFAFLFMKQLFAFFIFPPDRRDSLSS